MAIEHIEIENAIPRGIWYFPGVCAIRLPKYEHHRRAAPLDVPAAGPDTIAHVVEAAAIQVDIFVGDDSRK